MEQQQQQQVLQTLARCPTFKDYGEQIKGLEHENFQLKLRLFLVEKKWGAHHPPPGGNNNANAILDVAHSPEATELMREFNNLRLASETFQLRLGEAENRNKMLQIELEEGLNENEVLVNRNQMMVEKLDVLDRELALMKLKKQEDDDIEKCMQGFHGEDEFQSGQILPPTSPEFLEFQRLRVEELENELKSWADRISLLEDENSDLAEKNVNLTKSNFELSKRNSALTELCEKNKAEIKAKDKLLADKQNTFVNTVAALHELGIKYKTEQGRTEQLETKVQAYKESLSHQKEAFEKSASAARAKEKSSSEKLLSLNKSMKMLELRLHEMSEFVEAVLDLESKGLAHLPGLTAQHRQSLKDSVNQSQLLLQTIKQSLAEDWNKEELMEANKLKFSKLGRMGTEHLQIPKPTDLENVNPLNSGDVHRQDSSPDLGIESGVDAHSLVSSPKQPHFNFNAKASEEYKTLKGQNKELASKLKHTKLALAKTLEKLNKATADKEQFEKAVCRELHQTHSILKEAQVQLEVVTDVPQPMRSLPK